MERNDILANGIADYNQGRKAALRSLIWFGFGYHKAMHEGDKEARDYIADTRALLKDNGAVKSEQSTKASITKRVGEKFAALFGPELASDYADDADRVQACYLAAMASGATTVKRLDDWATHGNPSHTDDEKARLAAEKKAEKEAAIEQRRKEAEKVTADPMGLDVVPVPIVKEEGSIFEPEAETAPQTVQQAVDALVALHGWEAVKDALLADAKGEISAVA